MRRQLAILFMLSSPLLADQVLDPHMHHLRVGLEREWGDFPKDAEGDRLSIKFNAKANDRERSLCMRHRDVRHNWKIQLNGKALARLNPDDSETVFVIAVPPKTLKDGENLLEILSPLAPGAKPAPTFQSDDIMIGRFELLDRSRADVLGESALNLRVIDAAAKQPIPARITIVDDRKGLAAIGTPSGDHLAIRPGVVYTSTGQADIRLSAGKYTLYVTRGFEWGIDSANIELKSGETITRQLAIRREVDTTGYVACDPHMHTATYARHGDATMAERMVTLAGEGIELPVSTEHNLQIDFDKPAIDANVRSYFTPVLGNELTTVKFGHFNVFPIETSAKLVDFRAPTWKKLFASADEIAPGCVSILNHGRDIHHGFRPLDPSHHIALAGEVLDDWLPPIHAMEVINSGATTIDPLVLFRDWLGLLNQGMRIAPIGASDSHDVSRYIVGQGRTYIRCDDADPGNINVRKACESVKQGRVLVSFGLLVDMKVNGQFAPGDLAKCDGELEVRITIQGPSWTRADGIALYANGIIIKQEKFNPATTAGPGVKWSATWKFPRPKHDISLVALATGPGIEGLHWPIARPYQPTSIHWVPYALACTGAVYVDADASGRFDSPRDYAIRVIQQAGDPAIALARLKDYDASVAVQAAASLRRASALSTPKQLRDFAQNASDSIRKAFNDFASAWQESIDAAGAKTSSH